MEIKIPKEVRSHKEALFFGLSARQFFCSVLAVGVAVGVYFLLKDLLGRETAIVPSEWKERLSCAVIVHLPKKKMTGWKWPLPRKGAAAILLSRRKRGQRENICRKSAAHEI